MNEVICYSNNNYKCVLNLKKLKMQKKFMNENERYVFENFSYKYLIGSPMTHHEFHFINELQKKYWRMK